MAVTALVAAGAAWFVTDRSTTTDVGEPLAATADPSSSTTVADTPTEQPSWLFSLTATGGTFGANAQNPSIGTLTLTGATAQTTGFTDRPARDAVSFGTDQLVSAWPTLFADSDPNAVLVARSADGSRHTYVMELSSPTVEGTSLTFQVAAIEGKDHSSQLPGMTIVPATVPPSTFGESALFIDNVVTSVIWVCKDGSGATIGDPPPSPGNPSGPGSGFYAECIKNGGTPAKQ